MSRVAASSTAAAARCGWSIHMSQMRSSVSDASMAAHAARRRKSCDSAARSGSGRRSRRVAMRSRMFASAAFIRRSSLMEIARSRRQRPEKRAVVHEAPGDQVHDLAVALDGALHAEEPRAEELAALALDQARPDDDIDRAEFVFERDEYHAARGVGPLTTGHQSSGSRARAVGKYAHVARMYQATALEMAAHERERMPPEREPEACIIGHDVGAFARGRELGQRLGRRAIERRAPRGAGCGPVCQAAMPGERAQRARTGERAQILAVQLELVHGHIRLATSNAPARGLGKPAHHAQAQAQRPVFERAVPVAGIYVRRPELYAVAAGVLHELRRRIEAHRLAVQECGAESGRMMAFEP